MKTTIKNNNFLKKEYVFMIIYNRLEDYSHCNKMGWDLKTLQRFWSKVNIPIDYENDCWLWTASLKGNGYGSFRLNGKDIGAHKFAYLCYNGPISKGLLIRHTCDIKNCVNPYHLLPGTYQDNSDDATNRNRLNSKLTNDDVKTILNFFYKGNITCKELSKMYQVSMSTINKIINGKWWKHIYCQLTEKEREQIRFNIKNNQNLNKSSLKSNDIIEIRKLYKITNITQKDLAKKFNVNIKTINEIINRKSWKHI